MNMIAKCTRRTFLKLSVVGIGSLGFIEGCSRSPRADEKILSDNEAGVLAAVAGQIIPADEWPGGRENGVVTFIDKQLAGPYRRFLNDYRTGLAGITDSCVKTYQRRFEVLPWDQQMSFLKDMESGRLDGDAWKDGFSKRFFELLRSHSLQAYYGSPRHGGNKNYVSYKMVGLDYPPIIGQNRYRS